MSFPLRDLGTSVGSREPRATTFTDNGLLALDSPLRQAYSHAEPTVWAWVAASLRLLRDPYVVYALPNFLTASGRSLLDHLTEIWSVNAATVFGDTATAAHAKRLLETRHRRRFSAVGQPAWFRRQLGGPREFSIGDARLQTAVTLAFASAAARAHQVCGVLQDGADGERYCQDIANSLGWVTGVTLQVPTLRDLHIQGDLYMRIPPMGPEALAEAGVPPLLDALLATTVAPGVTVETLMPQVLPLMWEEDRNALGLRLTSAAQHQFYIWAARYAERAGRHMAASSGSDVQFGEGEQALTEGDLFAVSIDRVVYS